ncbi:hypothetical protein AWH48_11590 [Domibacillus aminovorans]|uniref:Phage tail protein n=1 Tax=Domibacillus aminovorans TaxID=29332 RepID=A0A177KL94_9BACI|nr:hypothetical protein [Domibacillus aminovorans]OAH53904.1 hypothetical protein AWH48_11590 [Domibacillus aminovorans]
MAIQSSKVIFRREETGAGTDKRTVPAKTPTSAPKIIAHRYVEVSMTGDNWSTRFLGSELKIQFEVPFDSDTLPNESVVRIFNLGKVSLGRIGKGMGMTIQAGYVGNYGVLTRGKITNIRSYREGPDRITEIKMLEGQDVSAKKAEKSITFQKNVKGDVILRKIVQLLGLRLVELKLTKNVVYKKGYVVSGNLVNHLITVARDCGATPHYRRGGLVIRSLKEPTSEMCLLSEGTGLIGSPEGFAEEGAKGYRAISLLQHKITPGVMVQFQSRTSNGQYRVRKGKHLSDGANEFKTEIEVV